MTPASPPPSALTLLLARDPRKLARLPTIPVDAALAEWPAMLTAAATPPPAPEPSATAPTASQIATLATQLWRTRTKLDTTPAEQLSDETKKARRHLESSLDTLANMGVTISDHLRQPYDPGLPVNVITYHPVDGLTRDTIIETIRPSVYWHDRLLQPAEVIVGTPPA